MTTTPLVNLAALIDDATCFELVRRQDHDRSALAGYGGLLPSSMRSRMTGRRPDLNELWERMDGGVEVLRKELQGLRTGRASVSLLEPVVVEAYGAKTPITQVGTINAPEPRLLTVQVWDRGLVKAVERAIRNSALGLNPAVDGQLVRVPLPQLAQERRNELVKVAHRYAEQARVAVRNVRRDGMNELKRLEKAGDISQAEHNRWSARIQEQTDKHAETVNRLLERKEQDILEL
jgi:ribosome recycling factor